MGFPPIETLSKALCTPCHHITNPQPMSACLAALSRGRETNHCLRGERQSPNNNNAKVSQGGERERPQIHIRSSLWEEGLQDSAKNSFCQVMKFLLRLMSRALLLAC